MQNFIRPIAGIFFGVAAITMNAADSDSRYASWPDYQGDDLELRSTMPAPTSHCGARKQRLPKYSYIPPTATVPLLTPFT